jgi:mono/diheme cytochrome c family protein
MGDRKMLMKALVMLSPILLITACKTSYQNTQAIGIGSPITEAKIQAWNIDVGPTGAGLPAGSGTVEMGKVIYQQQCASCHGDKGQGGVANKLVGGGSLNSNTPVKTVGSYWPYSTTIFDYIRRAMPHNAPQSLTDNQVYAITAYILFLNNIVPADAEMNARLLPLVRMPNRDGFIPIER